MAKELNQAFWMIDTLMTRKLFIEASYDQKSIADL
jgi:hypothetical protein